MTKSNSKKKKAQLADLAIDKENDKLENSGTPKAPATSKHGAFKSHNPATVSVAPAAQVDLLVTDELEKAMEECRTKVAQIVKGCRAANRRFRDIEFDLENDKMACLYGLDYDEFDYTPPAVRRVTQIFEQPQFFIDGADAVDIIQGKLDDCWFLAALATMSTSKGLIEKLCVARDEEVGVYGFIFFHGSNWVSLLIDDQLFWSLPKYEELSSREQDVYRRDRDAYNKHAQKGGKGLHFARSGTEGETWVPLIEKAYAKLHGDYDSLSRGFTSEAIEDMTGGVSVVYRSNDILDRDRFWKEELLHATQDRLFNCALDGLDLSRKGLFAEKEKVNGLVGNHTYSILRVRECKGKRFVVIRNPWGASEWTGAWGDGSKEWTGEWLDILKDLNHVFGDDGEFVMEYNDFLDTFELIERTTIFDSSWVLSSHWLRVPPQKPNRPWSFGDLTFNFTLDKPSFTIIALSQLDTRYFKDISGVSEWNIDFVVYKRGDKEITGTSFYAIFKARSVTSELHLEAGEYIIFPRYDRYAAESRSLGYFKEKLEDWDKRKLSRVLSQRASARSIANNVNEGPDEYFPSLIEALIEEDLEKLEAAKQTPVDDDDDEHWEDEDEEEEEEGEEGDVDEAAGKLEDDFMGLDDKSLGEDEDPITLGVRIYTQGGVIVSLTGQVIGEEIDDDDEEENEDQEEEKEEKEDAKKEEKGDAKKTKKDKKTSKQQLDL